MKGMHRRHRISAVLVSLALVLSGLSGCRTLDQHDKDIYSPDRSLKVEVRNCFDYSNGPYTQVSVLRPEESTRCRLRKGVAGFDSPNAKVVIRWLSNDSLEVSHPEYPQGFPSMHWGFSRAGEGGVHLITP